MKSFLDSIMEIDALAKEKISQGDIYTKEAVQQAEEKKFQLEKEYNEKLNKRIDNFTKEETEYYNNKKGKVIEEKNEFIKKIQQIYNSNKLDWENTIFNNIIKK